jgi:hypothetical protein
VEVNRAEQEKGQYGSVTAETWHRLRECLFHHLTARTALSLADIPGCVPRDNAIVMRDSEICRLVRKTLRVEVNLGGFCRTELHCVFRDIYPDTAHELLCGALREINRLDAEKQMARPARDGEISDLSSEKSSDVMESVINTSTPFHGAIEDASLHPTDQGPQSTGCATAATYTVG